MATIVHGNLTIAGVAVITGYILGVIVVGIWVCKISITFISSRAAPEKLLQIIFSKFPRKSESNVCRCSSK